MYWSIAISDSVTKNGVQFFYEKTTQCSKKQDKLHSIMNNVSLFLAYLSSVRQGKDIWNTFLAMKTKLTLPFYQSIGVFDQQKESQALLGAFFTENAQLKVQTLAQKYLTVQQ